MSSPSPTHDQRTPHARGWQLRWGLPILALLVVAAFMTVGVKSYTPSEQTRRLLAELADRPGHFELFWSGRSSEAIQADFKALGSAATPHLIEALNEPDPEIRRLAAGQLGELKETQAVETLIEHLQNDSSEIVRVWAAVALGEIGDRRAVPALLNYIDEPKPAKRWCAIQALGKIGDPIATVPILNFLNVEDVYTRAHAAEAVGLLDHAKAIEPLIEILKADPHPWVRSMAATSLARIQDPRAHAELLAARQDDSWRVQEVLQKVLPGRATGDAAQLTDE